MILLTPGARKIFYFLSHPPSPPLSPKSSFPIIKIRSATKTRRLFLQTHRLFPQTHRLLPEFSREFGVVSLSRASGVSIFIPARVRMNSRHPQHRLQPPQYQHNVTSGFPQAPHFTCLCHFILYQKPLPPLSTRRSFQPLIALMT